MTSSIRDWARTALLAVATAFALSILVACGGSDPMSPGGAQTGGGTDGGTSQDGTPQDSEPPSSDLSLLDKWRRFENGNPTLNMTDQEVRSALRSVLETTTHITVEDPPIPLPPESLANGESGYFDILTAATAVTTHNGVRIAEVRQSQIDEGHRNGNVVPVWRSEFLRYEGWLDHTAIDVFLGRECDADQTSGCFGNNPEYTYASVGASSAGVYTGTNPTGSGSATWNGVMVGMESIPSSTLAPDVFLGNARITVGSFASPNVDVSFTNIVNTSDGTSRNDISWNDLAIERGLFMSPESDNYIFGSFNGPGHEEAGGQFSKDGITGAFGAKRQ